MLNTTKNYPCSDALLVTLLSKCHTIYLYWRSRTWNRFSDACASNFILLPFPFSFISRFFPHFLLFSALFSTRCYFISNSNLQVDAIDPEKRAEGKSATKRNIHRCKSSSKTNYRGANALASSQFIRPPKPTAGIDIILPNEESSRRRNWILALKLFHVRDFILIVYTPLLSTVIPCIACLKFGMIEYLSCFCLLFRPLTLS